jgi:alanine-synthesizing transaminase
METFADRLKAAMNKQGLKQVDLVRLAQQKGIKLGKSHVSQYVSGKTIPRTDILHFLADALQVDPDWLNNNNNNNDSTLSDVDEIQTFADNSGGMKVREFKKSSKLNNVLYDVRGPVVDEAARMEEMGTHVLKLNIGNPAPFGFRTPDEVIYDMSRQLSDCEGYSASAGLFSARKAIMQYAQLKHLPNVTMNDIYTGNGVSELINLTMSALLDTGDEILIPSPDYPLWTACATLAGGKPVHYICDEQSDWYPDIEDMRKKINDRTKAIVIINPNNPTGALYPKEVLQQIVDLAREHQLIIFSDEIYDRLVMDGKEHVSIASLAPDLFCVTFSGLSKSHMIAGFRIGWMILSGNKNIARDYIEGIKMLSNMRLCSNVPAQSIVQTALGGYQSVNDYIVPGGRIYEQREYVYKALTDIPGISAVKPQAAFYMFPKIDTKKFNIVNDEKFALDLLREKKILIVQGSGFNWHQPDHFRVVYLPRIEVLKEAVGKIGEFLQYYRQ